MKTKKLLQIIAILIIIAIAILLLAKPKETSRGFRDGIESAGGL